MILFIVAASVIVQLFTILVALRLANLLTTKFVGAVFLLGGLFRLIRNCIFLWNFYVTTPSQNSSSLNAEILGLLISALFLVGLWKLKPIIIFFNETISKLKESEQRYLSIVQNSADGILVVQDQLVKFINPRLQELTGYSLVDAINKPFVDFIDPSFKQLVTEKYINRLSGKIGPNDKYEIFIINKKGTTTPVELSTSLIEYENKLAILSVVRDVSERKNKENKKEENEEEILRINEILVGREMKLLELKKENAALKEQLKKISQ